MISSRGQDDIILETVLVCLGWEISPFSSHLSRFPSMELQPIGKRQFSSCQPRFLVVVTIFVYLRQPLFSIPLILLKLVSTQPVEMTRFLSVHYLDLGMFAHTVSLLSWPTMLVLCFSDNHYQTLPPVFSSTSPPSEFSSATFQTFAEPTCPPALWINVFGVLPQP